MFATMEHLGIGIYTPAEAAFYARISPRTMSRWVFGDTGTRPVIDKQLENSDCKIVTFRDFVQTLAVREVRHRHGLSLQRIRQGIDRAREVYKIDYPLACMHRLYLFSDQQRKGHGEILIRLDSEDDDSEYYYEQLTGKSRGNRVFKSVVELFLNDLTFDPESKFATQYRPMSEGKASVLLNPHRRFGEPLIEPSGYTVESLWHATNTEGGIKAAADVYGVSFEEVSLANKYYDMLSYKTE